MEGSGMKAAWTAQMVQMVLMVQRVPRMWPRIALWSAAGAALALVSLTYLNPHLMLDLADKLWSCF